MYTVHEIEEGTIGFSDGDLIGCGAFGKVYCGDIRHTDVAIKLMKVLALLIIM